jgi:hypothetical protein
VQRDECYKILTTDCDLLNQFHSQKQFSSSCNHMSHDWNSANTLLQLYGARTLRRNTFSYIYIMLTLTMTQLVYRTCGYTVEGKTLYFINKQLKNSKAHFVTCSSFLTVNILTVKVLCCVATSKFLATTHPVNKGFDPTPSPLTGFSFGLIFSK